MSAYVVGIGETPRLRHPGEAQTTLSLMRDAVQMALRDAGLGLQDIDGFAVASFSLKPDRAIDAVWRLGLSARWLLQDNNGGASAINMLDHAVRGIEAGAASNIVVVGGDLTRPADFAKRVMNYNSATRDHLAPLSYGGPNALFAMLTTRQMRKYGLDKRHYGHLAVAQRQWAMGNPIAAYRSPLSMEEYLSAPIVAEPLCRYDCVPVVAGASALVLSAQSRPTAAGAPVRICDVRQSFNYDDQAGDGLETGLRVVAPELWRRAGFDPQDMDVVSIYDDYPAMVYAQLADLGFVPGDDIARFAHDVMANRKLAVNTGGGMLSCGQAGSGSGVHGVAEVARQLQGRAGDRQVPGARRGVVSGYGMALYRYCACAGAAVLERAAP